MTGFLSCPACGTSNIALGTTTCPGCSVGFATPVVNPHFQPAMSAVATAPAPARAATIPHAPAQPSIPREAAVEYASIWRRLVACLVDTAIVGLPFLLVVGPTEYFHMHEDSDTLDWYVNDERWQLLEYLAYCLYATVLIASSHQGTLGTRWLGMRVVREDTLEQLTFGRSLGRELLTWLSGLLLSIGYLMIAFTAKRQALHDKIAGTVVVRDPR